MDAPLNAGALQYDRVTPTGPLGEPAAPEPNPEYTDGIDSDTDSDTDTETQTDTDTAEMGGSTSVDDAEPAPDTDGGKYGIERDDASDDGRQGLLASTMRGNG